MALEGWFDTTLVAADWFPLDLNGWFDETLVSKPSGPATHSTTGSLTGQIGSVTGSSARFHAFDSTGALTASAANVSGSAARSSAFVTHDTSGALSAGAGAVAGASARFRAFSTSGALTGQIGSVSGSAARFRAFSTSGDLTGQIGSITGSADHQAAAGATHATSGNLVAQDAIVVGDASRVAAAVTHDTSGSLSGQGAVVSGDSVNGTARAAGIPKRFWAKRKVTIKPPDKKPIQVTGKQIVEKVKAQALTDALLTISKNCYNAPQKSIIISSDEIIAARVQLIYQQAYYAALHQKLAEIDEEEALIALLL